MGKTLEKILIILLNGTAVFGAEAIKPDYSHAGLFGKSRKEKRKEKEEKRKALFPEIKYGHRDDFKGKGSQKMPPQNKKYGIVKRIFHYERSGAKLLAVKENLKKYFIEGIKLHYKKSADSKAEEQRAINFVEKFLIGWLLDYGKAYNYFNIGINNRGEGVFNFNNQVIIVPKDFAVITALACYKETVEEILNSRDLDLLERLNYDLKIALRQYDDEIKSFAVGMATNALIKGVGPAGKVIKKINPTSSVRPVNGKYNAFNKYMER